MWTICAFLLIAINLTLLQNWKDFFLKEKNMILLGATNSLGLIYIRAVGSTSKVIEGIYCKMKMLSPLGKNLRIPR
jgi:hypothetical protein